MAWYNASWTHKITYRIKATHVSEVIHVIPVELPSTDSAWWTAVATDGSDIRVVTSNGVTVLSHYLVPGSFDKAARKGLLYVKANTIMSTSADVDFDVYAGNGAAMSTSSGSTTHSSTNIVASWTLSGPDALVDITGNGNGLTANNSPTAGAAGPRGSLTCY